MNTEQIRKTLKIMTEGTGELHYFKIFSDGSGGVTDIRGDDVCSWDDECEMYLVLLSKVTPQHCAKETFLKAIGEL